MLSLKLPRRLALGLCVLSVLGVSGLFAQPSFTWMRSVSGDVNSSAHIGTDPDANVYLAGIFEKSADLDPGTASLVHFSKSRDNFLLKLDRHGALQWAFSFADSAQLQITALHVSGQSHILLAGIADTTVDFDPGPGVAKLPQGGPYIVKFHSSGAIMGLFSFGSDAGSIYIPSLSTDPSGNIAAAGTFFGVPDFDPGPSTYTVANAPSFGFAVFRLGPAGQLHWAYALGDGGMEGARQVACDSKGNVYAGGVYDGTVDFDPGPATHSLEAWTGATGFVLKFDPTGKFQWVRHFETSCEAGVERMAVDQSGNVFSSGHLLGTSDFLTGPGSVTLTSDHEAIYMNIFMCKLDAAGNLKWASKMPLHNVRGMACDSYGNVYFSGFKYAGDDIDEDLDPGGGYCYLGDSTAWGYVMSVNTHGAFNWAYEIPNLEYYTSPGLALSLDYELYVSATFSGTKDFAIGPATHTAYAADHDAAVTAIRIRQRPPNPVALEEESAHVPGVYPNPSDGSLTIACAGLSAVKIFDPCGRELARYNCEGKSEIEIGLSDPGLYLLVTSVEDRIAGCRKIVVRAR